MRRIFAPHADGLGDHLLYTTLPARIVEEGDECWISTTTGFRNQEVRNLLWDQNPFVTGFTVEPPDHDLDFRNPNRGLVTAMKHWKSPASAIEACAGLYPSPKSKWPVIYRRPQFLSEFQNVVIVEPHSSSQHFSPAVFEEFFHWVVRWQNLKGFKMLVPVSKHSGSSGHNTLPGIERYPLKSLSEYQDILYSCHRFLGNESGANSLAAAVLRQIDYEMAWCNDPTKMPDIFGTQYYGLTIANLTRVGGDRTKFWVLVTTMSQNDFIFLWPEINYCVTGKLTPDYHAYPENSI